VEVGIKTYLTAVKYALRENVAYIKCDPNKKRRVRYEKSSFSISARAVHNYSGRVMNFRVGMYNYRFLFEWMGR